MTTAITGTQFDRKATPAEKITQFQRVTLTPQQERLWTETRTALLWHAPAFSHIFYTLMNEGGHKDLAYFTPDVPIAATDGSQLFLNPETFFKYGLNERVFICSHEILHCIFDHCRLIQRTKKIGEVRYSDGTKLPWDQMTMNKAMDYVINDALVNAQIGKYNTNWLHDTKLGTEQDSVLDVYKKVYKAQPPQGGKGGQGGPPNSGQGAGQGKGGQQGFDEHLAPGSGQGKDPEQAAAERNEGQWQTEVAAAINSARLRGQLPASLDRLLGQVLEPVVDWKDKIRGLFKRKVGNSAFDWRKLDRRLIVRGIGAPGRMGYGCGLVVVAVDTSGSIGQKELDMFFAEMRGILEDCRPEKIMLMWADAKVHRVDDLYGPEDLQGLKPVGGGGTDFVPVFDEIRKLGVTPEALVYLTDLYGRFPSRPTYPVIWGSISKGVPVPFGDLVEIPKQA